MKTITEFSGSIVRSGVAAKARLESEGLEGDALTERLGQELGLAGDRAARLREALDVVGAKVDEVRLVRVFAGEDQPKGATKAGEFNYLVDLLPKAAPQGRDRRGGRDRGGPGRKRGPGGPGPALGRDGLPREDKADRSTTHGIGWTFTRDPSAPPPGDRRGRKKPGGPRRGPRPGRPGQPAEGKAGANPGGERAPRGPRPPRPPRPAGPRPPHAGPHATPPPVEAAVPGTPGVEGERKGRRRRGRRGGRGRGGPASHAGAPREVNGNVKLPATMPPPVLDPDAPEPGNEK